MKMIFPKPAPVQNQIYSAEMRRVFGVENLRFLSEFDRDGNFILPRSPGFYVPRIKQRKVTALEFYDYSILRQKKAA
jgi:hypothetical protein